MMEYLIEQDEHAGPALDSWDRHVPRADLVEHAGVPDGPFPILAGNLIRLGLCDSAPSTAYVEEEEETQTIATRHFRGLESTPLGRDFVKVCRGPS